MPTLQGEKWGPGKKREYLTADGPNKFQDGTPFTLFMGEHPHTRSDNNIYADLGEGQVPVGFDGHRIRTKIIIEEANYLKSGMAGEKIRAQCWADIFMNDTLVYRLTDRRHAADMLLSAHATLERLRQHPVQLWRPNFDGLIGRRVWYGTEPAAVIKYFPDQGAVLLAHARAGSVFPRPVWDEVGTTEQVGTIKIDILDTRIWWFRSEPSKPAKPKAKPRRKGK